VEDRREDVSLTAFGGTGADPRTPGAGPTGLLSSRGGAVVDSALRDMYVVLDETYPFLPIVAAPPV
jgi:hypothetical protein